MLTLLLCPPFQISLDERLTSAARIDTVYEVTLPYQLKRIVSVIASAVSFGLADIVTPLACVGLNGYRPKLIFFIVTPFAFVALLLCLVMCWLHVGKHRITREAVMTAALPWALKFIFLAYPVITNTAFDAFPCLDLCLDQRAPEDLPCRSLSRVLKTDVSVDCDTSEYDEILRLAWLAIILYPIGLILLSASLLWRARRAILSARPTPLSRAIEFLHHEYEPSMFWWELLEMFRRFVLVGLMVLFHGPMQVVFGPCPTAHRQLARARSRAALRAASAEHSLALNATFTLRSAAQARFSPPSSSCCRSRRCHTSARPMISLRG